MEVLNLFSVILDLLAWTALIRLLYCPGLKFDLRFWSYITLIAVIEQIFVYQDKILHYPYVQFDKNTKPNYKSSRLRNLSSFNFCLFQQI